MANLKQDLDEYLLLQSDQKKNFKIDMKMPSIKVPDIFRLDKSKQEEANSWLKDTQDSCCPKLGRLQRIVIFIVCISLGCLCMFLSTFYVPVLVFKARKFCLLYTLGSIFFIAGFCILWGFGYFFQHLVLNKTRALLSLTYIGSLIAVLYFALIKQDGLLTPIFGIIQIISLVVLALGAIPGGSLRSLKFLSSLFCRKRMYGGSLPM